MYPVFGMRQMADNDILFDSTYREKVRDIFLDSGYEIEAYNKGNHDVYQKNQSTIMKCMYLFLIRQFLAF